MVKIINEDGKEIFQCEVCKFRFLDKKWADTCEKHCKKYAGCRIDIIEHAIK